MIFNGFFILKLASYIINLRVGRHFKHSLRYKIHISTVILTLTLLSCDRIKRKSNDIADKTKEKVIEKKDAVIDKVIPTFNSYTPDTKFNKKRFEEFFGFAPTEDVKEIYCFADEMGIDSKYLFSFKCDPSTKNKIVDRLHLTKGNQVDNFSRGLWQSFAWWDSVKIETLPPYYLKTENRDYQYLWFDEKKNAVYYISFDM